MNSNNQLIASATYNPEQVQLIKTQLAPNATDNELKLFLYQCERTGLNPMARQIYCIHRGGKMTVQVSIDGFRLIAERTKQYAGQSEPEIMLDEQGRMTAVKVTVFRFSPTGERYPAAVGVAYWQEYAQNSPMWTKMPRTMLSKCAEAVALRKAFPQELSGLYTSEEMEQAGNDYKITDKELIHLENLLESSTIEEGSKEWKVYDSFIRNPETISQDIHFRMKKKLTENQKNKLHDQTYSQTDYIKETAKFN